MSFAHSGAAAGPISWDPSNPVCNFYAGAVGIAPDNGDINSQYVPTYAGEPYYRCNCDAQLGFTNSLVDGVTCVRKWYF